MLQGTINFDPLTKKKNLFYILTFYIFLFRQKKKKVFKWLENGNKNRSMAPTDANEQSSRSHAVFQITIRQRLKSPDVSGLDLHGKEIVGKLSLIDLAGSERAAATNVR